MGGNLSLRPDPFDDAVTTTKPRGFPTKLLLFMLLFMSTTAAAGYYAWEQREALSGQTAKLQALNGAQKQCEAELAAAGIKGQVAVGCEQEKAQLAAKQQEIEVHLAQLEGNLNASKAELEELRRERAESERMLSAFKDATDKLKNMIDAGTLEVTMRNGSMVVRMPAEVLFPSGSAQLSEQGQIAVIEVGVILKQFPDRRFLVVGHTDNVPLKSAQYSGNWALSTARALTVTEFLVKAGMKPERLIAAGHGEYDPVGDNKTVDGRQKNRRIDIVLLPTIPELPKLQAEGEGAQEKAAKK